MSAPEPADTILTSEFILTMGETAVPGAGFVALAGERIIGVGPLADLPAFRHQNTSVLDFGRRPILPGFIDDHCHMEMIARTSFGYVDVRTPDCSRIADVLDRLRDSLREKLIDGWLLAQANLFYDQKLSDKRFPNRADLDRVSKEIPIAIRAGGHLSILNSKALELAGINRDYRPPEYAGHGEAHVEKDASGAPNGILKEMDDLVPFPKIRGADLKLAVSQAVQELFTRYGVTSICEMSTSIEGLETTDKLIRTGQVPLRMAPFLTVPRIMKFEEALKWREHIDLQAGRNWVDVKGVKIYADGGYSAASAAVKQPYTGAGGAMGKMGMTPEQLQEFYVGTQAADMGLAVHTNGDRAQEFVCNAVLASGGPLGGPRIRLEHAGNFLPDYEETVDLWSRAGALPVPQPTFLYTFGDFFPVYLGEYGKRGRFPFRKLMKDGWPVCGSSDVYAGSENRATNPMFGIWCAVERQTYMREVIDEDQRLSVAEGLRMYTADSAKILGQHDVKGSLEPGKLADLVILDRDPRMLSGDSLLDTAVDYVYVGGRLVHERPGAAPMQSVA